MTNRFLCVTSTYYRAQHTRVLNTCSIDWSLPAALIYRSAWYSEKSQSFPTWRHALWGLPVLFRDSFRHLLST